MRLLFGQLPDATAKGQVIGRNSVPYNVQMREEPAANDKRDAANNAGLAPTSLPAFGVRKVTCPHFLIHL